MEMDVTCLSILSLSFLSLLQFFDSFFSQGDSWREHRMDRRQYGHIASSSLWIVRLKFISWQHRNIPPLSLSFFPFCFSRIFFSLQNRIVSGCGLKNISLDVIEMASLVHIDLSHNDLSFSLPLVGDVQNWNDGEKGISRYRFYHAPFFSHLFYVSSSINLSGNQITGEGERKTKKYYYVSATCIFSSLAILVHNYHYLRK